MAGIVNRRARCLDIKMFVHRMLISALFGAKAKLKVVNAFVHETASSARFVLESE